MTINFFAQNILKGSTFALCLLAILFAAAFVAKAQPSGEKPNIEQLFVAIDKKDQAEFKRIIAADVDLTKTYGDAKATALHQAAAGGTPEMIKVLLSKIYINERDANNRTALFYATFGKNLEALKVLLRAGADVMQKDQKNAQFDQYAEDPKIVEYILAQHGDTEKMWKALLANDNQTALQLMTNGNGCPNQPFDKMTALMFAAKKGDAVLFDKIMSAGGDVSTFVVAMFPPYRTALDVAAETGSEVLVKKIMAQDLGWRKTAILSNSLAAAVRGKSDKLIPVFLAAGANVNKGYDMTTPIREAVLRGDAAVLKSLVANGATKETLGEALEAAFKQPNSATLFQILLDAGADVNQNIGGFSALTQAAETGNIGILKLLTSKGAEQQSVQNAFVVAAEKNQVNAMRFLMSLPVKPDLNKKKQSLGSTPLIEAVKNDAYEAVRYLVAKGADINFVEREDFNFDSPLTIAARDGDAAMINYLLNFGANPNVSVRTGSFGNEGKKTALDFAAGKPEILKTLQRSIAPQQIARNLEFLKFMMNAGDLAYEQKLPEAVAEYNRALAVYPDSNNIYLRQIPVMITLKDFASAEQTAGKVLAVCQKPQSQCNPATLAEAHNFRVVALIRLQKFADALFDADKAAEFCVKGDKPCSFIGSIHNNRGVIYREKKMFKEALADLNKAIEIMPQTGRPYFHRARTHYLIGDFDKATADLAKARELDQADEEIKAFQITREQALKNKTNSTN